MTPKDKHDLEKLLDKKLEAVATKEDLAKLEARMATKEALALHHADWLDGSIRGFLDVIESEPLSEAEWTRYSKMLKTELYRGPAQPSDEVDVEDEIPF